MSIRARAVAGATAAAAVLAFVLLTRGLFLELPPAEAFLPACLVGLASVVVVGATARQHLWSGGLVLVLMTALFHLGLPAVVLLGADVPERYLDYLPLWFARDGQTSVALWLTMAGLAAFALGYALASAATGGADDAGLSPAGGGLPADTGSGAGADVPLAGVGLVVTALGASMYLGHVAVVAPALLTGGGGKRLYEATVAGSAAVSYGTILVSIGSVLAASAPRGTTRRLALAVFAVFTAATLAFGSRTAALYAVVTVVVVLARVRTMPRQRVAVLALVAGLLLVSGVQQVRDEGVGHASLGDFLGSPSAAVAEMGLTLRPLVETVGWVEAGEEPRWGHTYLVGVQRFAEGMLGLPRPASSDDQRFAGVLSRDRVEAYQIGYSIVAEAYLNFGPVGTALFFCLLGAFFGRRDGVGLGDPVSAARYGMVLAAVAAHVRQASNITLTSVLLGLAAVEIARSVAASRAATSPERLPDRGGRATPRVRTDRAR